MANDSHVKELLKGVESWNAWRRANPNIIPDLRSIDLRLQAIRNTPLVDFNPNVGREFVNLDEINLRKANLHGANFQVVRLHRANFREAQLEGATFQDSHLLKANFQGANLVAANFQRAILVGADFMCANLSDANFQEAGLTDSFLQNAKLVRARFQGATLWRANFWNADLRSANFGDADINGIRFNRDSLQRDFRGIRAATAFGSQTFKSFAQDQEYIEELYDSGWGGWLAFWIWYYSSNCGRSLVRWAAWAVVLAVSFGAFYYWLGTTHIKPDPPLPFSFITMIYYSVVTFTTLGFGDVKPQTELAAVIVMFEVIIGYVMLGGLISILANKLARRA
jgi:uncharacterized protein YjbI with pentapeptide repeats